MSDWIVDISHVRLIKVAAMKLQSLLKSGRPMEEARNSCAVQMVQAAKVIDVSTFHLSDHLKWRYKWKMEGIYVTFWKSEMTLCLPKGRNLRYLLKIWNVVMSDKWKEFTLPFENLKWHVWQMEGIYVTFWKSEMTLCLTNGRNLRYLLKIWNDVMSDKWEEFTIPFENLKWRYVWQMEGIYVTFWKSEMTLCLTNGRNLRYLLKIWNDVMSDKWKEFTLPFENLKWRYVWQKAGIYVTS